MAVGLAGCGTAAVPHPTPPPAAGPTPPPPNPQGRRDPLTGQVAPRHGPLVAVMIENSEYGRPQYGLGAADVVYEAYTENFYYSRFMALYYGRAPAVVGPVRSARPYFVDWVRAWNAAYAHAGGSSPANAQIVAQGIHDMDAITRDPGLYWRSASRAAPHNLFTDVARLMQAAATTWGNPPVSAPWSFAADNGPGTPPYTRITMTWNARNTVEQWRWNAAGQDWVRYVACPDCRDPALLPVMDPGSNRPVTAANVVIQYTNESLDLADANVNDRWIQVQTDGQGRCLLFLGHRFARGTWVSDGSGQPTRFYLDNGQPAAFAPGPTWIEVVPQHFALTLGSNGA
ncbi:MAG: DUF3048 domain-containing protein [Actinomycetia bacterium]|nr:DUF3048 domain-containing protein [Actinomycetes bacterium]